MPARGAAPRTASAARLSSAASVMAALLSSARSGIRRSCAGRAHPRQRAALHICRTCAAVSTRRASTALDRQAGEQQPQAYRRLQHLAARQVHGHREESGGSALAAAHV